MSRQAKRGLFNTCIMFIKTLQNQIQAAQTTAAYIRNFNFGHKIITSAQIFIIFIHVAVLVRTHHINMSW